MRKLILTAILAIFPISGSAFGQSISIGEQEEVDLQLVLAADRSGSMSAGLGAAQRQGFATAFREPTLQQAIASGPLGKIAVVYFEWSGSSDQEIIVPWTVLSDTSDMVGFAEKLESAPKPTPAGGTSISAAMVFSRDLIENNGYTSYRKVVDISGNGRNSDGPAMRLGQRLLREAGATVNGLILPESYFGRPAPYAKLFEGYDGPLEAYYRSEVIGGPAAFAVVVDPELGFGAAILRKLLLEVAWSEPETAIRMQ